MDYYIQGNAANADRIRAALKAKGISDDGGYSFVHDNYLYFTEGGGVDFCPICGSIANIIKTHPDYKELELPVEPKHHYDIANFKPFDKVLIRVGNKSKWTCDFFSYYHKGFHCIGTDDWSQCIPFNDDTKHLLGTTDMCPEEYINW